MMSRDVLDSSIYLTLSSLMDLGAIWHNSRGVMEGGNLLLAPLLVWSKPSKNPDVSLSSDVAEPATPSLHIDKGAMQARKNGSKAFRVQ